MSQWYGPREIHSLPPFKSVLAPVIDDVVAFSFSMIRALCIPSSSIGLELLPPTVILHVSFAVLRSYAPSRRSPRRIIVL